MSPDNVTGSYGKGGTDLADALEEVANDPDLMANPEEAFAHLGMELPTEVLVGNAVLDPEELLRAADAIRAGAIPAFWPWIWWIPWVMFRSPPGGGSSA
jgi:hypothetical protein